VRSTATGNPELDGGSSAVGTAGADSGAEETGGYSSRKLLPLRLSVFAKTLAGWWRMASGAEAESLEERDQSRASMNESSNTDPPGFTFERSAQKLSARLPSCLIPSL
jgi:hypothetical protein